MQYSTKKILVNWVLTLEGKTPVIDGRVYFHLHFGGIHFLFGKYLIETFLNWLPPHSLRVGIPYMTFLCRSGYFTQFLAKENWLFYPQPTLPACGGGWRQAFMCILWTFHLIPCETLFLEPDLHSTLREWGFHTWFFYVNLDISYSCKQNSVFSGGWTPWVFVEIWTFHLILSERLFKLTPIHHYTCRSGGSMHDFLWRSGYVMQF